MANVIFVILFNIVERLSISKIITLDPAEVPPDVGDDPGAVDDGDDGRSLLRVVECDAPAVLHH